MHVLLLLPYAWDTVPGQRFRIEQWYPWLRENGVQFDIATLLTADEQRLLYSQGQAPQKALMMGRTLVRRLGQLRNLDRYDAVWLHRAALMAGPPLVERALAKRGVPVIMEFDDAIYLTDTAQVNRRWGFLKFAGKTSEICRLSTHVVVGNQFLAEYARQFNSNVTIIPTTIDTDTYQPRATYRDESPVVIGWSGSRTTVAHLRTLDPALKRVAAQTPVRLHVIGTDSYPLEGVETYAANWTPQTELEQLERFDLGVMPLPDEEWARGKCGLKALQYMAAGIPTVTSPVGVNSDIIRDGSNGFLCATEDEWVERMLALIRDVRLRERLGRAGRTTVENTYAARVQAPQVLEVLQQVSRSRGLERLAGSTTKAA